MFIIAHLHEGFVYVVHSTMLLAWELYGELLI